MRLEGVGRRYGTRGRWVLRGVDLDVPSGTLIRIEGANGTGKSTLLRLLAGVDLPSAGRVRHRPRAAYVPERFPAALPFRAADYLTHLGRIHGLSGRDAARRARAELERFGIGEYADTPMDRLSKGSAQKVAVAQALLADAGLLVLDEAWTGLDTATRDLLDTAVTDRVAAGGTVVFVDHDPRRLAGAGATVHRVAGSRLIAGTRPAAPAGPVLVEAAAPGTPPPDLPPLPPSARPFPAPPGAGTVRIEVAAADSDAVLRALLDAAEPWHIRAVRPAGGAGGGPGEWEAGS